ncbi:glycosyltransferase family 39 protein [Sporolactobacillus laevolacticus]|uniref:Glycosyltransferase RgtA/B/C/D-like domain-containing protein n=1 Tax=Sporolactobacillus laevolacticus DSM 442 TaxID=1395513 RepID=V6IZL5_9BACL|nr:glycosyltransferase family 39 protein [Sporolactobacillus laevolacticus]EST12271.1 hypothetical protein P343_08835 [Sporolactobacillus laevolacticus DSM 442]
MINIKNYLIRTFCIVFALFVSLFLMMSVIGPFFLGSGSYYGNVASSPLELSGMLFFFAIVVFLFFLSIDRLLSKCSALVLNRWALILFSLIILFECFILIAFRGIQPPEIDGGHIIMKALDLLKNKSVHDDSIYFNVYPNNLPVTLILFWIYRLFPIDQMQMLFMFNHALCMITLNVGIYFSWKLVLLLLGRKMSTFFLIFVLTCAPIFFYTLYFYSDTLMVMMPPLLIYLWFRYEQSGTIVYGALACVFLGIGCIIRQNLILFLPALVLFLLLRSKVKKTLMVIALTMITYTAFQLPLQMYTHHMHLGSIQQYKMPSVHWIMLGLSNQGRYHIEDFRRSFLASTQEEKKRVDWQEIKERLSKKTPAELAGLWLAKAFRVYADGSMGYYWYTGNTSEHNLLFDYFFGGQKQITLFIIQIFHIVNLFLLLLSVIRFFRIKKPDTSLLIQIMLFGNYLFYIFLWEAEPRYALLFLFPMLIGNCYGVNEAKQYLDERIRNRTVEALRGGVPHILTHILFCMLISIAALRVVPMTQTATEQYRYAVNQNQKKGALTTRIDASHAVQQTFHAERPFDHISLGKAGARGKGVYVLSIYSVAEKKQIEKLIFSERSLAKRRLSDLPLTHTLPGKRNYRLAVYLQSGTEDSALNLAMHGKGLFEQRDLYLNGTLFQNNMEMKGKDLQFRAYMRENRPYLSLPIFILLLSVPFLMIVIFADTYRRTETFRISLHTDPI